MINIQKEKHMTTPNNDFDGMPVVYSAIFTAVQGAENPLLEPNHPWAAVNPRRVRVPKGVVTVQVSTNYVGTYHVLHQEVINGTTVNNTHTMVGSGVIQVRAVAEGSTLFITAPNTKNSTDNWGLVVTSVPSGSD